MSKHRGAPRSCTTCGTAEDVDVHDGSSHPFTHPAYDAPRHALAPAALAPVVDLGQRRAMRTATVRSW